MHMLSRLFSRRRRYDDIAVSIQEHIDERADELEEEGMPRDEAERTARREFGNVALQTERSREAWQWPMLESLLTDLRFTLRRLRKSPGFAVTVLLTLAIGIGANTAVFTVLDDILIQPLPYPDSNRIVALRLSAPGAGGLATAYEGLQISPSMSITFQEHNRSFSSLGIWVPSTASITGIAQPEQVKTGAIGDGILETFAVPPLAGRWLSHADQAPRGTHNVMLSYGYWQRRFGGDRTVLGRSLQIDGVTYTVIGIMPPGFRLADYDFDLLLPLQLDRTRLKLAPFGFYGVGRLKPGVTLAQADADIAGLIPIWMDSWTNGPGSNPHYYEVWRITPGFRLLKQQVIGNIGSVLWIVMGTVGLVMLIACTNVANLLLVRAESRHQELAVRAALGAGRLRIARELLVESLVLGLAGGAIAIAVAAAGLRLLVAIGPAGLPRLSEISLNTRALGFTFLLSVFSGLLLGAIPALKMLRTTCSMSLSGSTRTASESRGHRRTRNVLVMAQVAIALVLMVAAVLMVRSFASLRSVTPGFSDAEHVEAVTIAIPRLIASDPRAVVQMQRDIADRFAAIPGISSASFAAAIPMDGTDPNWDQISVEGRRYENTEPPLEIYNYVAPGYFPAMGTRLVAGRDFTWDDIHALRPMVIVSERFARESWGSAANAVGKRLKKYSNSPWQEVIGVAQDVRVHGVDKDAPPIVYWPILSYDRFDNNLTMEGLRSVTFVLHGNRAGTQDLLGQMQQAAWSVNANLPLASVATMQQVYALSMTRTSFTLVMLAIAGSMSLALSIVGIYGVISYAVSQRTREIGIRLALGAQRQRLRWMFVGSALSLAAAGIMVGLVAAAMLARLMRGLLFGISALDPFTFLTVPLILVAAAALASFLPATRAAGVDPARVLKADS